MLIPSGKAATHASQWLPDGGDPFDTTTLFGAAATSLQSVLADYPNAIVHVVLHTNAADADVGFPTRADDIATNIDATFTGFIDNFLGVSFKFFVARSTCTQPLDTGAPDPTYDNWATSSGYGAARTRAKGSISWGRTEW